MKEKPKRSGSEPLKDILLNQMVSSPLTEEINSVMPPAGFSRPKFTKYDVKPDPYTHLV